MTSTGDTINEGIINPENSNVQATDAATSNEYSYLKRSEFTSEIYKIEVRNLGYFGIGEFKKLLKKKLELDITKIKSPKRKEFAYVCFRSKDHQERAIEILNGYKWKGRELKASIAQACADPFMKRRNENNDDVKEPKRQRTSGDAACPLAVFPYNEQLKQKNDKIIEVLESYKRELKKLNKKAIPYINEFKYEGMLPSPQINGYRNKNEFTIGKNANGDIVVGFRLGCYSDGSVEVEGVQSLPHIPQEAKWAARTFEEFVQKSKFLPFNPEKNAGHFRQLMVRSSASTGELMLVAGIYSSNLTESELLELKETLKDFYENCKDHKYKCSSLYYQDVKRREAGQLVNPVEHLSGTTHITDSVLGLKFRISPLSFFQINTKSAEVLYQRAIDLLAPTKQSTMLDICCGTGAIALSFAKYCNQVLGVEIIPDAIKDAEFNANANNIRNCKFYTGNADDIIKTMVREADAPWNLIAVVDPPRAGLHAHSVAAIRACKYIKRLVYIACNPENAKRNFIELARPESKQYSGDPFYPKRAVAVDMFPHTTHTDLLLLFERDNKFDKSTVDDNQTIVSA